MKQITRALPHLITALALAATATLIAYYADAQAVQLELAETMYFMTGWEAEVVDAAYQAITADATLPCPARAERALQGRGGNYVLAATITRAQHAPTLGQPIPACGSDSATYLIRITAGSTQHPTILQGEVALDLAAAQANPEQLLRPAIRPQQSLVFTASEQP